MNPIPCFFLTQTDRAEVALRRYCHDVPGKQCPGPFGSHDVEVVIGVEDVLWKQKDGYRTYDGKTKEVIHSDERWPARCASCEYLFVPEDEWQTNHHLLYSRSDLPEETITLRKAPVGAMWYVDWGEDYLGPDGKTLMVKVPAVQNGQSFPHEWCIDGRASNCTLPDDTEHRCWCRAMRWSSFGSRI